MSRSAERERAEHALLVGMLFAACVVFAYLHVTTQRALLGATALEMIEGRAATPFQYRLLITSVLGLLSHVVRPIERYLEPALLLADAGFYFAFGWVARSYLLREGASRSVATAGALCLGVLPFFYFVLPPFRPFYHPYDMAGCFFLLASLLALRAKTYGRFSVLFLLGTLNRESVLLALVTGVSLLDRERSRPSEYRVFAALGAGWLAIKGFLFVHYASNRGRGLFELSHTHQPSRTHLATNLEMLTEYPKMAFVFFFVVFPLLLGVVARERVVDPVLRRFSLVAAVYVLVLLFIGNLDEFRLFGELPGPLLLGHVAVLLTNTREQV